MKLHPQFCRCELEEVLGRRSGGALCPERAVVPCPRASQPFTAQPGALRTATPYPEVRQGFIAVLIAVVAATASFAAERPRAAAPSKPAVTSLDPRGIERGQVTRIQLLGSNLVQLTALRFDNTNISASITDDGHTNRAEIEVLAPPVLPRGVYEFSVANSNGASAKARLHIDDLPQRFESTNGSTVLTSTPASVWGVLEKPGDVDLIEFSAKTGETLVVDLAAKSLGSKIASGTLVVLDSRGRFVAENNGFDKGDPLLAFTAAEAGQFKVRVADRVAGGSKDHFYRVTIGALPYVTGVFPLGVPAHQESRVELIGWNLRLGGSRGNETFPPESNSKSKKEPGILASAVTVAVKAGAAGHAEAHIDPEIFRSRRTFSLATSEQELTEMEPNNTVANANEIPVPGAVNGRLRSFSIDNAADADLFRFHARAGQRLILETHAADRGSPADTKLEILDLAGNPVPRVLLQAVRDSAINFRPMSSDQLGARLDNWEEMDLDQYIYLSGDVARLFRMPQGPDSDLLFYSSAGKRRAYFGTSATGHALEEPCYVVAPRPPGTKLTANGLPVFTVHYENDDDGERRLGSDSKIHFNAPATGDYLVRVADSRGFGGERFAYRLVVREARPNFKLTLNGANLTVPRGSGQSFGLAVERIDGFEGAIHVAISNVPPGFIVSTPLVIEAEHAEAKGCVFAVSNAMSMTNANIRVTASASIDGSRVVKEVTSLGRLKVGDAPKLFVSLEPFTSLSETNIVAPPDDAPFEITIAPGQTVPAWIKVRRNGHLELVTFVVENLPHGVIVDNIGLNGVLIPKGQNERQIFLTCARWVADMDRLCYAIEQNAGKQTSRPVWLKVRKSSSTAATK